MHFAPIARSAHGLAPGKALNWMPCALVIKPRLDLHCADTTLNSMIVLRLFLPFALFILASAVAAQQSGSDAWADISVAEWKKMVLGRTVTYRIGPQIWAQEAYDTGTNAVSIRLADGTCMDGTWSHTGNTFCFAWTGAETSCFRHVRDAGQILIVPMVDGEPSGTVQTVTGVSDLPLTCGPALSS